MLELLEVAPGEAVMVGDTIEDDIDGARAVGMEAVLIDREGRFPGRQGLDDLRGLSAALGLVP
jgi:putative hydrolase of the HAD superfamily